MQPLIAKVGIVETRIAQVETAFPDRMKEQVNLLTAITNTQSQHSTDLANLQNKDKANQEACQDIGQRRENLETQATSLRANSTAAEKMQPDLIMGGWARKQLPPCIWQQKHATIFIWTLTCKKPSFLAFVVVIWSLGDPIRAQSQ